VLTLIEKDISLNLNDDELCIIASSVSQMECRILLTFSSNCLINSLYLWSVYILAVFKLKPIIDYGLHSAN
jgi:hypothetical protein